MKRWHQLKKTQVDCPKVEAFMADIKAVCEKHNMSFFMDLPAALVIQKELDIIGHIILDTADIYDADE